MRNIVREKRAYQELLKQEIQIKYTKKSILEEVFQKLINDEWTNYLSLKRILIKKNGSKNMKRKDGIVTR